MSVPLLFSVAFSACSLPSTLGAFSLCVFFSASELLSTSGFFSVLALFVSFSFASSVFSVFVSFSGVDTFGFCSSCVSFGFGDGGTSVVGASSICGALTSGACFLLQRQL
ncbi:hypothetical protein ACJVXT_06165 [Staphylococcus pseudintermedius]|uniref:hypothetical protein n=1 Tax=Staphylococcus pseudintermedius TaxID=283734 RepID=UPI0039810D3E